MCVNYHKFLIKALAAKVEGELLVLKLFKRLEKKTRTQDLFSHLFLNFYQTLWKMKHSCQSVAIEL